MRRPDRYKVRVTAVSFVGQLVIAHGLTVNKDRRRFVPDGPTAARLVGEIRHGRQTVVSVEAGALYR